jgi:RNA polymerase sigma-70 factor, ECF subfamily
MRGRMAAMERGDRGAPHDLFERLSRGEPGAIDEVCRRYGPRVAAIARRKMGGRLRGRIETADVVQESMADIVRDASRSRFPSEAAFLRWTTAVVEHTVLDEVRRWDGARRGFGLEIEADGRDGTDPFGETPSRIVRRRETSEKISEGLALLSSSDRKVVIARMILELKWADVAASLGSSVAAAQMRFGRARGRLAGILRRLGIDAGA